MNAGLVLAGTRDELAAARAGLTGPVALVPTMGALHDGHRALLRAAREHGAVAVSIFVNPLQFGPAEDLDRYPRTLDADLAVCAAEGVRLVFAPSAAEMYPQGAPVVSVDPGSMGAVLEGAWRPGFFGGVLTVVLKLFALVKPGVAVFGEKDAQQLAMVRQMVRDLNLGVGIVAVPTVRDPDGLATSSRNRYLSAADREQALALPRALRAGLAAAGPGAARDVVLAAAQKVLACSPGVAVDYLTLVEPASFGLSGPGPVRDGQVLAVAARVGGTRLIDNMRLNPGGSVAADH